MNMLILYVLVIITFKKKICSSHWFRFDWLMHLSVSAETGMFVFLYLKKSVLISSCGGSWPIFSLYLLQSSVFTSCDVKHLIR
jgi:hypothetical protein